MCMFVFVVPVRGDIGWAEESWIVKINRLGRDSLLRN